jgi:hypothetical protein
MPYKDLEKKRAWQKRRNLMFSQMRAAGVDVARFILREARRSDTLDRIDNSKGHTRDNVVPACIRCNYARRNMPYEAWLCLTDGMKRARELGLFKEWTGRTR